MRKVEGRTGVFTLPLGLGSSPYLNFKHRAANDIPCSPPSVPHRSYTPPPKTHLLKCTTRMLLGSTTCIQGRGSDDSSVSNQASGSDDSTCSGRPSLTPDTTTRHSGATCIVGMNMPGFGGGVRVRQQDG